MKNLSQRKIIQSHPLKFKLSWSILQDYTLIILGGIIQGFAMRLFLIPAQLVSGGISGAAQIINFYVDWPIGLMTLLGNVPLFIIGWRYLGGMRFGFRTGAALVVFSISTDMLMLFIPSSGMTQDPVLNSLYGGIIYGVGLGLVYKGKGTSGGSDILCRILNHYFAVPIAQSYLVVDALVVLAGGFAFGWDIALYGIVTIYVCGLGAELISEGSAIFRDAMIITNCPTEVSERILSIMERGVTILPGVGAYTGSPRPVLYCVINRAEVNQLKMLVHEVDPQAFMVIGQANEALGEGFKPLQ